MSTRELAHSHPILAEQLQRHLGLADVAALELMLARACAEDPASMRPLLRLLGRLPDLLQGVADHYRQDEIALRGAHDAASAQSQNLLRVATESFAQGFALFDHDDRLVICNSALRRFFPELADVLLPGCPHEVVLRHYFRHAATSDKARMPDEFMGEIVDEDEYVRRWHDRRYQKCFSGEVQVNGRWLHQQQTVTSDGMSVVLYTDVDELKRLSLELARARDAAEAATRAKSEFVANMSRELRSPMNGIVGLLELTLQSELSPTQRENLSLVQASADRLQSLVNQLVDYAKIEAGQLHLERIPYSLKTLFKEALQAAQLRAQQKGLRLNWHQPEQLEDIQLGDPPRLAQVLNNLVDNAIKYTAKGSIDVRVERAQPGVLKFEVKDSGVGIAPDKLSRLFEAFSQSEGHGHRRFTGSGLGLAIARDLVQLMGGHISAQSWPGQGSCFSFTVSDHQLASSQYISQSGPVSNFLQADQLSILVVDDSEIDREVAKRLLQTHVGWQVDTAVSGEDALTQLATTDYQLILMNPQMGGMGGLAATLAIREMEARLGNYPIPIIAMTTSAFTDVREECIQAGMSGFTTKPLHLDILLAEISLHTSGRVRQTNLASNVDFDPEVLLAGFAGDREFFGLLSQMFLNDADRQLQELEQHCASEDWLAAQRQAQSLKGGAGTYGAGHLAILAERLDLALEPPLSSEQASEALIQLRDGLEQIRRLLQPYLPGTAHQER